MRCLMRPGEDGNLRGATVVVFGVYGLSLGGVHQHEAQAHAAR